MGIMKKKQITLSKKNREMRFNSLSEKVRKLLDSIDHQILIDKAEQWLLSLRKNHRNDLFERYFDKGFSLTELEDYAVFVALAEELCRDHVNRYLYPFDEPMGVKRIPIDALKIEIDDCPDGWITLFEAIICRIAKRHSVELPESMQQDAPDEAAENIEIDSLTKEQQWRNNTPDYMLLSKAIVTFAGGKPAVSTLSKKITPDGPIRYMRKRQRCKVHIGDFREYAQKYYPSDALAGEIVDEYMADIEARKAKERKKSHKKQ